MRRSLILSITLLPLLLWSQENFKEVPQIPNPFFEEAPDTVIYSNGSRYIGSLNENRPDGRGILLTPRGDTLYIGSFMEGRKHGIGRYTFKAGNVYQGEWRDNRMHGQGEMQFYTGDRYVGQWFADRFHGEGNYLFSDGSTYEGGFFEGKRHGKGMLSTTAERFHGQWTYGQKDGTGIDTLMFADHMEIYEGPFVQGKYQGEGKWSFIKDGAVTTSYEGNFTLGIRTGEGAYKIGERTLRGTWEDDRVTGSGICFAPEGVYQGTFVKGFYEGDGRLDYTNGDRYEGRWARGEKDGTGKMVWADGKVYEGKWLVGQPHGEGIMYLTNGRIQEGIFVEGKFDRRAEVAEVEGDNN